MVEDDREDDKVVAGWDGEGSPLDEVSIDCEEDADEELEDEAAPGRLELLGEVFFCGLGEDGCDLVLVEPVEETLLVGMCHV